MSGPVAFISQSGSFGGIANRLTGDRGYGLSKFIAIGNQGDLTATDFLEYLSYDDDTKVITMYMEGFKDGARFFEVARKVAAKKPILLMKRPFRRGRPCYDVSYRFDSRIGRCFRRHMQAGGNYRLKQLEHLFIMAEPLFSQPLPKGKRIGILANGGQGVVASDNIVALVWKFPNLQRRMPQDLKYVASACTESK